MTNTSKYIALCIFCLTILASCKTKRVTQKSPLVNVSSNLVLDQVIQNQFDFKTINAKLSVDAESPKLSGSFKINLRMNEDSAIWMSVTPALGIEAARLLILPDTLKYIDKLNKGFFIGDYALLDSIFRYQTQFSFIENMLVGNPVELLPEEKYSAQVEGLNYVLQTKVRRKLKKALQIDKKNAAGDTLYTDMDVVREKKFEKAVDKFSEDDLIIKRYYIRADDFRISSTIIDDVLYKRTVRVDYSNYEEINGVLFPLKLIILATTPEETTRFEINYSRIRTDEPQGYPFKIPSKYKPIP